MDIHLAVSDVTVNVPAILVLGVAVGFLSGFFGVGGGFIMTPMLNILFGIPYSIAAGTSLGQMLGTSIFATAKHRGLGNVDVKLGLCMLGGAWLGVEGGARALELLERTKPIAVAGHQVNELDLFVPITFLVLLVSIGTVTLRESSSARKRPPRGGLVETRIAGWVRRARISPAVSLRGSGIESISLWILLAIGLATGFLSGFLGVGGAFVLMPALIYVIGVPTSVAIGTGLFQTIFVAAFGCFSHALKQNVDPILVSLLLAGSILGAQIGAPLTKKVRGAEIRYWFSLVLYAAGLAVLIKLAAQLGLFNGFRS